MRCVDVNVVIYAHRSDLPEHAAYRAALERFANDSEPLGLADAVVAGFLRVISNLRVFAAPTSPAEAWAMTNALLAAPAAVLLRQGRAEFVHPAMLREGTPVLRFWGRGLDSGEIDG